MSLVGIENESHLVINSRGERGHVRERGGDSSNRFVDGVGVSSLELANDVAQGGVRVRASASRSVRADFIHLTLTGTSSQLVKNRWGQFVQDLLNSLGVVLHSVCVAHLPLAILTISSQSLGRQT